MPPSPRTPISKESLSSSGAGSQIEEYFPSVTPHIPNFRGSDGSGQHNEAGPVCQRPFGQVWHDGEKYSKLKLNLYAGVFLSTQNVLDRAPVKKIEIEKFKASCQEHGQPCNDWFQAVPPQHPSHTGWCLEEAHFATLHILLFPSLLSSVCDSQLDPGDSAGQWHEGGQ